jgi:hypothetical protein
MRTWEKACYGSLWDGCSLLPRDRADDKRLLANFLMFCDVSRKMLGICGTGDKHLLAGLEELVRLGSEAVVSAHKP